MFENNCDRDRDRDKNRETLQFSRENREPWSRFLARFLSRGRGFSYFRKLTATATANRDRDRDYFTTALRGMIPVMVNIRASTELKMKNTIRPNYFICSP